MNIKRGRGATEKAAKGMTDWNQLKALPDSDIVLTDDAPGTMPDDWADAVAHHGLPLPSRKAQIALRVDEDVLNWFKAQGTGYQTRMNAVLRAFRDAHQRE